MLAGHPSAFLRLSDIISGGWTSTAADEHHSLHWGSGTLLWSTFSQQLRCTQIQSIISPFLSSRTLFRFVGILFSPSFLTTFTSGVSLVSGSINCISWSETKFLTFWSSGKKWCHESLTPSTWPQPSQLSVFLPWSLCWQLPAVQVFQKAAGVWRSPRRALPLGNHSQSALGRSLVPSFPDIGSIYTQVFCHIDNSSQADVIALRWENLLLQKRHNNTCGQTWTEWRSTQTQEALSCCLVWQHSPVLPSGHRVAGVLQLKLSPASPFVL